MTNALLALFERTTTTLSSTCGKPNKIKSDPVKTRVLLTVNPDVEVLENSTEAQEMVVRRKSGGQSGVRLEIDGKHLGQGAHLLRLTTSQGVNNYTKMKSSLRNILMIII